MLWRLSCVSLWLLPEEARVQDDAIVRDRRAPKPFQDAFPMVEAERFVRAAVVELLPLIGIDVVHHEGHAALCEVVKGPPLGEDPPDQLVVDLDGAFLVRAAGVAVEDMGPAPGRAVRPELHRPRVGELTAVVREDDGEKPFKRLPAHRMVEGVPGIRYGFRRVRITEEGQHEVRVHEMDGEQHLPAPCADDRVHLDHVGVGMPLHEGLEIPVGPAAPAGAVHLELRLLVTGAVFHLTREVDVPHVKEAGIDIVIEGLLAAHELVPVGLIDLVDGLAVADERRDQGIDPAQLQLIGEDSRPALGEVLAAADMGLIGMVEPLFQGTLIQPVAAIADIGGLGPGGAGLFLETAAGIVAQAACAAPASRLAGAPEGAHVLFHAGASVPACIVGMAGATGLLLKGILLDLLGDGGPVLMDGHPDPAEGGMFLEAFLYLKALFIG